MKINWPVLGVVLYLITVVGLYWLMLEDILNILERMGGI
jgi:hypothetical protein